MAIVQSRGNDNTPDAVDEFNATLHFLNNLQVDNVKALHNCHEIVNNKSVKRLFVYRLTILLES